MAGMHLMSCAQPALLYLVPTCTIGILVPTIINRRFKKLWLYESELSNEISNKSIPSK